MKRIKQNGTFSCIFVQNMIKMLKYLIIAALGHILFTATGKCDVQTASQISIDAHNEYSQYMISMHKMEGEIYQTGSSLSSNNTFRLTKKSKRAANQSKHNSEFLRYTKHTCLESDSANIYKSLTQHPDLAICTHRFITLGKLII